MQINTIDTGMRGSHSLMLPVLANCRHSLYKSTALDLAFIYPAYSAIISSLHFAYYEDRPCSCGTLEWRALERSRWLGTSRAYGIDRWWRYCWNYNTGSRGHGDR